MKQYSRVLDVGCGFGLSSDYLFKKYGCTVTGINITPININVAKQHFKNAKLNFIEGDACDMPYFDTNFDHVFALECAFHFPSRKKFFQNSYSVLKQNGTIIIADIIPNKNTCTQNTDVLGGKQDERVQSVDDYKKILKSVGFKDVKFQLCTEQVITRYMRFTKKFNNELPKVMREMEKDFYDCDYILVSAKKIL